MKFIVEIAEGVKHGNQQVIDHAKEIASAVAMRFGIQAHHVSVTPAAEPDSVSGVPAAPEPAAYPYTYVEQPADPAQPVQQPADSAVAAEPDSAWRANH